MRPVLDITKRFDGGRLSSAVVTIYRHNEENRAKASESLGFPVTRSEFPQGTQMLVRFADDGTYSASPVW